MPRQKSLQKRRRILQAAVKVFAQKGYHGAKVAAIARGADVADGTIYLYFRNKEDILVSLFDEVMGEHLSRAREEVSAVEGAPARLLAIARHHLRVLGGNRDLAVVFQVELRQSTQLMARFTASWLQDYFTMVGEVIEAGQKEGTLRPDLPRKVATKIFFGALDELVTSWIVGGKDYDLSRLAAPMVDLFLHGAAGGELAAPAAPAAASAVGGK
jgi:TetR/AcrR family transcriptional regulator, fatty acid metabolism regulator protein